VNELVWKLVLFYVDMLSVHSSAVISKSYIIISSQVVKDWDQKRYKYVTSTYPSEGDGMKLS